MKIVDKAACVEEIIKKSRFIGIILPCESETEVQSMIQQQHRQHPHASHIVYAYRINSEKGLICRFFDAGEPSGTAGKPVYQHLEGGKLLNTLIIVIRYFGGTKLGAGGLTRAYGNIARKALDNTVLKEYIEYAEMELKLNYSQLQMLEYHLKKLDGQILSQVFSEIVLIRIKIPKQHLNALKSMF